MTVMEYFSARTSKWIWILLFLICTFVSATPSINVLEKTEALIRLHVLLPTPDILPITLKQTTFSGIRVEGFPVFLQDGLYTLPYKPILLHLGGDRVSARIISEKTHEIPVNVPVPYEPDRILGLDQQQPEMEPSAPDLPQRSGSEKIQLTYIGSLSGNFIWSADV